jgi:osmotically-inducible protein OsmY
MKELNGGYNVELWRSHEEGPAHDTALQERVWDEIRWEPLLNGADLTVEVGDAVVTIRGVVHSYLERRVAERSAARVAGVKALHSEILVYLPAALSRPDAALAEEVRHALAWNVAVPPGRLSVVVDGGRVTLEGEVERESERAAAVEAVEGLAGVREVIDRITLRAGGEGVVPDLPLRVTAALEHAGLHPRHLAVDVVNGRVVLRGRVRSLAERAAAEHAAWGVPGVQALDDRLAIAD